MGKEIKWCLVRSSTTLRTVMRLQMKKYNVTEVCREVSINHKTLYRWLNGEEKALSQYAVIRFCEKIGIKVSLNIEYV